MARFLVMASNQEMTDPRRGSKLSPWRHARTKASCATSSARSRSPSTALATPKTRAWNRRTNTTAASASPAAMAASSASSAASCIHPDPTRERPERMAVAADRSAQARRSEVDRGIA